MTTVETEVVTVLDDRQKMAVARVGRAIGNYGEWRKAARTIAKAIVNLRLTFGKDGRPDYRGETPQYRGTIAGVYEAAIPDDDERRAFKSAIRYWIQKEFEERIETGEIPKDALAEAGFTSHRQPPIEPSQNGKAPPTGIVSETTGQELSPKEVLEEVVEVVQQHVRDDSIGPVMVLQTVARNLGPVVAALRDEGVREKLPKRSLKRATEQVLGLALDAAHLGGVEVAELVAEKTEEFVTV